MRILVLDESYPHEGNLPGDMFVHVRVKEYLKHHDVRVVSFGSVRRSLVYEGVTVDLVVEPGDVAPILRDFAPERLLIHFFQSWMLDAVVRPARVPVIIWVHGYEALGWYRRPWNWPGFNKDFLIAVHINSLQQLWFRRLIGESTETRKISFVFASDWMRRVVQWDTLSRIEASAVIPNPVDTEFFGCDLKPAEQRHRVLLLRSFSSRKYANDLSVEAILRLARRPLFSRFSFTLVGNGVLFDSLLAPLRGLSNVRIQKGALPQSEIRSFHKDHGVFLCPTRQDGQGVSMCEAMSSGLVPVTSNNTAIPEFVRNRESGLLTRNVVEIARALEELSDDPDLFLRLSAGASRETRRTCGMREVIAHELEVIERGGVTN